MGGGAVRIDFSFVHLFIIVELVLTSVQCIYNATIEEFRKHGSHSVFGGSL